MRGGKKSEVVKTTCDDKGLLLVDFTTQNPEDPKVFYSPPTNVSLGEGPRLPDPFEEKYLELKLSSIPGAEEGVFAKVDIPHNFPVGFIATYAYRNAEEVNIFSQRCELQIYLPSPIYGS